MPGGDGYGGDFMQAAKAPATAPELSDAFNRRNYTASKQSDYVLYISAGCYNCIYDFKSRLVVTQVSQGISTVPFAQADRDALMEARDELVRLGGKPPPLPGEKPAEQKPDGLKL